MELLLYNERRFSGVNSIFTQNFNNDLSQADLLHSQRSAKHVSLLFPMSRVPFSVLFSLESRYRLTDLSKRRLRGSLFKQHIDNTRYIDEQVLQ